MIGAGQPLGVSKRLSYTMTADRYTGRVLYVSFRTEADLARWLPPPLVAADSHSGFLKLYQLKRRPEHGDPYPPSFSQYREACVTVLAGPPDSPARHYNLFMWVTHDWATYKARETFGWPKKLATIDITMTFPNGDRYDADDGTRALSADVVRHGYPLLRVRATLDPDAPEQESPPFNGFYSVRHLPAPLGGEPLRELLEIRTRDGWFGPGTFGHAEVQLGDAPDEELTQLGELEVTGCVLRDVGWVLPAWPAHLVSKLEAWPLEVGDPLPKEEK